MTLLYIVGLSLLGGVVGVVAAVVVTQGFSRGQERLMHLVSFAAGTMLAAAFFDLIPEAFAHFGPVGTAAALQYVLGGLLSFYVIEQFILISHCHEGVCDVHKARRGMVIFGDTIHNFLDGVTIAAAFLVSHPLGWITAIAVLLHEIPQEIGDVAVLLQLGMTRFRAIGWNLISALATIIGGVGVYWLSGLVTRIEVPLIALAGGGFIYIATVDLLPEIHKKLRRGHILSHILALFGGVLMMWFFSVTLRV